MEDKQSHSKLCDDFDYKKKKEERAEISIGGNVVRSFENDPSTYNHREIMGCTFSWGQNNEGQIGSIIDCGFRTHSMLRKKMKMNYPRLIVPLKDTLITGIACGHSHTLAITFEKKVLAWGGNKSCQLGLGDKAPELLTLPHQIEGLTNVKSVSCGSEHSVALTEDCMVYSWGSGDGGLLGHGNTQKLTRPKLVETLRNEVISSVVCGGLHTLALSKKGYVFSWGRGEGGQLGHPFEELEKPSDFECYLAKPKKILKLAEEIYINTVACGDAHSLALGVNGEVYGWGFTNSGQLGTGVTGAHKDVNSPEIQVRIPVRIESLRNSQIMQIFSGQTFSMFVNDRRDIFGCG